MTDVCLVDRWSSVLSRGGSFFLEPDADLEDSKSHCPVYTPCHKVIINDDAVLKDEYSKCFLIVLPVSFSTYSSLPPWCLLSPWTSSLVSITRNQETFPTQVSSTLDALRVMWETYIICLGIFPLYVVCYCKRWHDVILSFFQSVAYNFYEIPLFIAMGAIGEN